MRMIYTVNEMVTMEPTGNSEKSKPQWVPLSPFHLLYINKPTHYSRIVRDGVPGVAAVLCECVGGWIYMYRYTVASPHHLNS